MVFSNQFESNYLFQCKLAAIFLAPQQNTMFVQYNPSRAL